MDDYGYIYIMADVDVAQMRAENTTSSSLNTKRKLNSHIAFRRRHGRLLKPLQSTFHGKFCDQMVIVL